MKILLIGGYRFVGRAIIDAALERGDTVTVFTRGRSWPADAPDVECIRGDRRSDLDLLAGRRWDVAIDSAGMTPGTVGATATALRDAVEHYTFVSSISVYPWPMAPGLRESSPVSTLDAGVDPEDESTMATYSVRKALAESAAESAMPGRSLAVRPGMIVGPHDYLDRASSWLERARRGGRILAPGRPDRALQVIDVDDLARWIVALAERRVTGALNATGPLDGLTMGEFVRTCIDVTGSNAEPVWVDDATLHAAGLDQREEPLAYWVDAAENGIFEIDLTAARAAGLQTRPLRQTLARTLAWIDTRTTAPPERAFGPAQEEAILQNIARTNSF